MELRWSRYGSASQTPSPVSVMMDAFDRDFRDGVDVNLGVGYVNEETIPAGEFREALDGVLADPKRYRQPFNYSGPAGSANLIASLRRLLISRGLNETAAQAKGFAVGLAGATSILDAVSTLLEPGIVVTADPVYYIYADVLERKGFEVLAVPEDGEGIHVEAVEQALADRAGDVAFFYIVTVNNPTCTLLSNRRRRALVDLASRMSAEQNRRIPVFLDGAYELLLHDPEAEPPQTALGYDEAGLVYEIGTMSKVLAPGLRIGFMAGPPGDLMNSVTQRTSDAGFGPPLFAQEMASWMLDHKLASQLERVNTGYRQKALATRKAIDESLGPYVAECRGGSAGFYYYLTLRGVETHTGSELFRRLTRTTDDASIDGPKGNPLPRVLYIPGQYCVHPRGEMVGVGRRQLRLSYGYEPLERIVEAIGWMREAIDCVPAPVGED